MKVLKHRCFAVLLLIALTLPRFATAQDPAATSQSLFSLPDKFFRSVEEKKQKLEDDLNKTTARYLAKLAKREQKLKRKLSHNNPAAASEIFGNIDQQYDSLRNSLTSPLKSVRNVYDAHLDSMSTALNFIKANNALINSTTSLSKIDKSLSQYADLQQQLNGVNHVQELLKARHAYLNEKLINLDLGRSFKKYQQEIYYYRARVEEYKNIFNEPGKIESVLLKTVNKIPAFRNFFNKHSQLASLFRLPIDGEPIVGIPGLQTRAMVMQNLDERLGSGPNVNQMMGSSIQAAQTGLDKAKKKMNELGNSGADMDMPDFKPNSEKSKSFLKRLELGFNFQSVKSNLFFPVTTDVGLSLGYKFSSKAVAGIGGSYKVGWGKDFKHISITHEGVGLRSFIDVKIKSSFWISGGGEMNYRSRIDEFEQLRVQTDWQKSALFGISKKYKLSGKLRGNMQLLYDFLYRNHPSASQPVIFRFGYQFK